MQSLWQDLRYGMRGIRGNPGFSLLASDMKNSGIQDPVRPEIWAVDKNVALTMTRTLDDFLSDFSYAQPRFLLAVLGVFAGVGLVLVAVGVYSVIAYTVSRQTHEIGIRMALGASRGDVIGMVLQTGCWRAKSGGSARAIR
jgi:ABC-type antimicrobial peptide transport system permease subunit